MIFSYFQAQSPTGTRMTALGVFILVSLLFVMATIFQFMAVLYLERKQDYYYGLNVEEAKGFRKNEASCHQRKTKKVKIDVIASLLFSLSYISFNVIYWTYYLSYK